MKLLTLASLPLALAACASTLPMMPNAASSGWSLARLLPGRSSPASMAVQVLAGLEFVDGAAIRALALASVAQVDEDLRVRAP